MRLSAHHDSKNGNWTNRRADHLGEQTHLWNDVEIFELQQAGFICACGHQALTKLTKETYNKQDSYANADNKHCYLRHTNLIHMINEVGTRVRR